MTGNRKPPERIIMKLHLRETFDTLKSGLANVIRIHPVETGLCLLQTGAGIVSIECAEWKWGPGVSLVPLFFALALALNLLAGRGPWRRVYLVAWAPLIPLWNWPGVAEWIGTTSFVVTLLLLGPLAVMLSLRSTDNRRFAADAMTLIRAAALAVAFTGVALALFQAILWSTAYIFAFSHLPVVDHLSADVTVLCGGLCAPLLFLMMLDRRIGSTLRSTRTLEILINRIITPALIVYAALLYLYTARIVVTWSLPRGGVAEMITVFTLATLITRMVRELQEHSTGEWFYRRFSWVMLAVAVLFWAGIARRVSEYGFTESRVWLLLCGIIMTLAVVLFLSHRTGRYLWLCAATFALFAAAAFIPALSPKRLGIRSQRARFGRLATELGRLDAEGRFDLTPVPPGDTVRRETWRQLFSAWQYLGEQNDTLFLRKHLPYDPDSFSNYGAGSRLFPDEAMRNYVVYGFDMVSEVVDTVNIVSAIREYSLPAGSRFKLDPDYPKLWIQPENQWDPHPDFAFDGTRFRIFDGPETLVSISAGELAERQAARIGCTPATLPQSPAPEELEQLLLYRDERVMVLFSSLLFDNDTHALCRLEVALIMTR